MVAALFFAEHRSAINSPIAISSTLLSLNLLTLDHIGLVVSFSVSLIHITWILENALFISQFCSTGCPKKNVTLLFWSVLFILYSNTFIVSGVTS